MASSTSLTRIEPLAGSTLNRIAEVWTFRELLYFLAWRDFKVRYKQTSMGVAWAVLQPLFTMAVFAVFLGRLAKVPSDGVPYPLFSYAGLLPWMFFASGLTGAANSMISNSGLVKKVYFPRIIVPLATVLVSLIDLAWGFTVLLVMMPYYHFLPGLQILWLPLFAALGLITCLGVGVWLAALNAEFRDVRHSLPFLVQFWLFATPVVYPSSLLQEPWRTLIGLNPMAGVVEGFRWALLQAGPVPGPMIAVSALVSLAILFSGILYFNRVERNFADVL